MIRRFLKVKAAYNVAVMQEKNTKQFFIEEDVKYLQALNELLLKFHISTNWLSSQFFLSKNQAHPGLVLDDVYCVSTMIDPMLKFGYWREDEIIVEQELKCRSAFSGFLKKEKFKAITGMIATASTTATTISAANKSTKTLVATTAFANDDDEEEAVAMISTNRKRKQTVARPQQVKAQKRQMFTEEVFINRHKLELEQFFQLLVVFIQCTVITKINARLTKNCSSYLKIYARCFEIYANYETDTEIL
ncbi:hypothetical protein BD408DRAFT_407616 [Parasitella parasitica]|nr:hypothetical protein BD408DRAFT_407616 [Parasitella parasitica]